MTKSFIIRDFDIIRTLFKRYKCFAREIDYILYCFASTAIPIIIPNISYFQLDNVIFYKIWAIIYFSLAFYHLSPRILFFFYKLTNLLFFNLYSISRVFLSFFDNPLNMFNIAVIRFSIQIAHYFFFV